MLWDFNARVGADTSDLKKLSSSQTGVAWAVPSPQPHLPHEPKLC